MKRVQGYLVENSTKITIAFTKWFLRQPILRLNSLYMEFDLNARKNAMSRNIQQINEHWNAI